MYSEPGCELMSFGKATGHLRNQMSPVVSWTKGVAVSLMDLEEVTGPSELGQ